MQRGYVTEFRPISCVGGNVLIICENNTQTAVINIINLRIINKLDVSYASQHTFSKVTVTIF